MTLILLLSWIMVISYVSIRLQVVYAQLVTQPSGNQSYQSYQMVGWPSGLRRWFKAPVISMAWVRIPPLPIHFFPFFPHLAIYMYKDSPSSLCRSSDGLSLKMLACVKQLSRLACHYVHHTYPAYHIVSKVTSNSNHKYWYPCVIWGSKYADYMYMHQRASVRWCTQSQWSSLYMCTTPLYTSEIRS